MKITRKELNKIITEEFQIYSEGGDPWSTISPAIGAAVQKRVAESPYGVIFSVLKALSSGVTDTLKEEVAEELLEYLEIDPGTPLSKIFINFIGNITLDDLARVIIGGDRCVAITSELGDALAETIVEGIPETLGLAPKSRITKVVRESLSKTLTQDLSKQISAALCDLDYSGLVEGLPGGKLLKKLFFKDEE